MADTCTGGMWQKDTADPLEDAGINLGDAVSWSESLDYCESMSLAGYDDWRLPNVRELIAHAEVPLLREERRITDARPRRADPRRRPPYPPTERLVILELKAARGRSKEDTSKRFLVEPATVAERMRRVDDEGKKALVQTDEPVNRLPDSYGGWSGG